MIRRTIVGRGRTMGCLIGVAAFALVLVGGCNDGTGGSSGVDAGTDGTVGADGTVTQHPCTPDTATELDHDVSHDTVISPGCYRAAGLKVHGGASLTIQGGATILFEQDTSLWVESDGVLESLGTADASVVLSAVKPIRGGWKGISIHGSPSQDNRLEYTVVEYGGGGNGDDWGVAAAGVALRADPGQTTALSMSHSTIRDSASWGFAAARSSLIGAFDHNQITANADGAANLYIASVAFMDSTTTYSGNDNDFVNIHAGHLDKDATWQGLDVPYRTGSIEARAVWTIAPGAVFEFKPGAGILVGQNGRLTAEGSQTAPITFTGVEKLRGSWCGIDFLNSLGEKNRLGFVTIEYGGGCGNDWGGSANLMLSAEPGPDSRVVLHDSLIRQSKSFGIYSVGSGQLPDFARNVITENADAPVRVRPDDVHFLDDTSTYTGNDKDVIWVSYGDVKEDQTWAALDVPYHMSDTHVHAHLTILPSVTILFDTGKIFQIHGDGSLTAMGTTSSGIVFTGVEKLNGSWCGVDFLNSMSSNNKLSFVTIEYGGGCGNDWGWSANLMLSAAPDEASSALEMHSSVIQHSEHWGAYVSRNATVNTDFESDNTFSDNADGTVHFN